MKTLSLVSILVFISLITFAQVSKPAVKGSHYGKKITNKDAVPAEKFFQMVGTYTLPVEAKVSGKIVEVCEKKGCFMKMDLANGETMMVRFKDYGFFVPTNLNGKTVVIHGIAKKETISVDDLRHEAEDANKSEKEIAAIQSPKTSLTFEASGVLVM